MHAREKHNARNQFYSLRLLRFSRVIRVHSLCALHDVRQLGNQPFLHSDGGGSVRRSAHVGPPKPAIDKFLCHDGWEVCEIRRSTLVRDIIIKVSALNKWMPVSPSAWVAGGRADLLQVQ